jgi:hypothetical protein
MFGGGGTETKYQPRPSGEPHGAPAPSRWSLQPAHGLAGGGAAAALPRPAPQPQQLVGRKTQRTTFEGDVKTRQRGSVVGCRDDPGQGVLFSVLWNGSTPLAEVR